MMPRMNRTHDDGDALDFTAFMSIEPMPGMVKMVSVTMAPPMQPAKLMPTCVMTGTRLLPTAWCSDG